MIKEERTKYQSYIVKKMKSKSLVKWHGADYIPSQLIYSVTTKGEEIYSVKLDDVKFVKSSIYVGIDEVYKENSKE